MASPNTMYLRFCQTRLAVAHRQMMAAFAFARSALAWSVLALTVLALVSERCRAQLPDFATSDIESLEACADAGLLRWDNVQGPPLWVSGCPPSRDHRLRVHVFTLHPGRHLQLHTPAGSVLRVRHLDRDQRTSRLVCWMSNGSGLARQSLPSVHGPSNSWLLAADQLSTAWIRLELPDDAPCAEQIVCYVSRRVRTAEPALICDLFENFAGPELCVNGTPELAMHRHVRQDIPVTFNGVGPSRLRLTMRYLYDPLDSETQQTFTVRILAEDRLWQRFDLVTTVNRTEAVTYDGHKLVTGNPEVIECDIPGDLQNVTVICTANVLLSAQRLQGNRAVRPTNLAEPTMAAAGHAHIWSLPDPFSPDDGLQWLGAADTRRMLANRAARDNRHLHGGLLAWNLLRDAAVRNPADSQLVHDARERWLAHTLWHSLLPESAGVRLQLSTNHISPRRLLAPGERPKPHVAYPQFLASEIDRLPTGRFVELGAGELARYALPSSVPDTQVRLLLDVAGLQHAVPLELQFDARPPVFLEYQQRGAAPPDRTESGLGEFLRSFDDFAAPLPCVSVASHELNLPLGVRTITLRNAATHPLRVCVQQRRSRDFQLSEASFWYYLEQMPGRRVPLASFLGSDAELALAMPLARRGEIAIGSDAGISTEHEAPSDDEAYQELRNHYEPLLDWLRSQSRMTTAALDLGGLDHRSDAVPDLQPTDIERLQHQASVAAERGHYLDAVARFTQIVERAAGVDRGRAILARADALRAAGEAYLARNELIGRALTDPDYELRDAAMQRLLDEEDLWDDANDKLRFLAACVAHDPSARRCRQLAQELVDQGEFAKALLVGLACAESDRPHSTLLAASLSQQWWRTFEASLASVNPDERGQWDEKRAHFAAKPQEIYEAEFGTHWRGDDSIVVAASRTEHLTVHENERGMEYYQADPEVPAELLVQGPAELMIEARPLHPPDGDDRLQDWIWIRDLNRQWVWAVHDNARSGTLKLSSGRLHAPGHADTIRIPLGPGAHRLLIRPHEHSILFRTFVKSAARAETVAAEPAGPPDRSSAARRRGKRQAAPLPAPLPEQSVSSALAHEFVDRCGRVALHPDMKRLLDLPLADQADARRLHADSLLYLAEQNENLRAAFLIYFLQYRDAWPADPYLRKLEGRIQRWGHWQSFREVSQSAGIRPLQHATPAPQYDSAQIRFALTGPAHTDAPTDYLLGGYRQLHLNVVDDSPVRLELVCSLPRVAFVPSVAQTVEVAIEGARTQRLEVPSDHQPHAMMVTLPPGAHQVSVRVLNPVRGQYVHLAIVERLPDGSRRPWSERHEIDGERPLYYAATAETPVQVTMQGPMWIRVEQVLDGYRRSQDHYLEHGQRTITLPAADNARHTLYRITEFVLRDPPTEPPSLHLPAPLTPPKRTYLPLFLPTNFVEADGDDQQVRLVAHTAAIGDAHGDQKVAEEILPMPPLPKDNWDDDDIVSPEPIESHATHDTVPSIVGLPAWESLEQLGYAASDVAPDRVALFDAFPLSGHEDGTWGFGAGVYHRRALEEGLLSFSPAADQFAEQRVSYDHFSPWTGRYQSTSGLLRFREDSGPTIGVTHDRWFRLDDLFSGASASSTSWKGPELTRWWHPWHAHVQLEGYAQRPGDPLEAEDERWETSFVGRGQILRRIRVTDRVYHFPSATFLARYLSLQEPAYRPGRVDQDIFTRFKADHQAAFLLSDTWYWQTDVARRWWLRPALFTNEDLNPFQPDHASLQAGVSSLWRSVHWELAYRVAEFLADDDRRTDSTQHLLYFDTTLDHWQHAGSRWELDLSVRHELDSGDTGAVLTLTWFRSRGRGYQDHHPSRVEYRDEREQLAFPVWQRFERGY